VKKFFIPMIVCTMLGYIGCDRATQKAATIPAVENRSIKMPPKKMAEPSESEDADSDAAPEAVDSDADSDANVDADLSCDPKGGEDQCGLIPVTGCLGCANGEEMRPVNKEAGRRIMGPKKDQCLPEMKNFKGPKKGAPVHENCKRFNMAKCSAEGICVGVKVSEAELKRRMPKQGQGEQPGQGGPGQRPGASSYR
jgi:hypothetical protein